MEHHTERLRIAGRIQHALTRRLRTRIDIEAMLSREDYAREVLFVCEGLGGDELVTLAEAFKAASAAQPRPLPPARVPVLTAAVEQAQDMRPVAATPQDAPWAQDTSGFGVTRHPEAQDEEPASAAPARSRLRLPHWFKRDNQR